MSSRIPQCAKNVLSRQNLFSAIAFNSSFSKGGACNQAEDFEIKKSLLAIASAPFMKGRIIRKFFDAKNRRSSSLPSAV